MNIEDFNITNPKTRWVKKGEIVQQKGTPTTKGYFVKKGLLLSYSMDEHGKISVFMFAPEGWLISDIQSHTLNEPAELFIDALEDSEIIEIGTAAFYEIDANTDQMRLMINKLLRRVSVLQKRVLMLMSASAHQRYQHFIDTYPQLVNRIPQKMIASYLGITPEALSTIRAKFKKEKV